jgi:hypothetical protein
VKGFIKDELNIHENDDITTDQGMLLFIRYHYWSRYVIVYKISLLIKVCYCL